MTLATPPPVRVLVVDDSVFNRRSISEILAACPDIQVVGRAADGDEALRLVSVIKPDAITLDLEMPRMDGFTFLRIIMSRMPTPVVVVSSYSQKENVFKALELGALDFVAKPDRYGDPDLVGIREELVRKVLLARSVRRPDAALRGPPPPERARVAPREQSLGAPKHVVAVASSTGGPSALVEIFAQLPNDYEHAIVIAQHMPEKFTRTFAERLDRRSALDVSEGQDQARIEAGSAWVCPGRQCMEVAGGISSLRVRVCPPAEGDRYVPSADRLLRSVAECVGSRAIGVILTGMGDDGVLGARAIIEAGGTVLAESESTAVVYGMPGSAVRAGVASEILPLNRIAERIAKL